MSTAAAGKKVAKVATVTAEDTARICEAGGEGWECDRTAKWTGLCLGHYKQQQRGQEFQPLRPRTPGGLTLIALRITPEANEAIARRAKALGIAPYKLASRVLEAWARLPDTAQQTLGGHDENRHEK